MSSNFAPVLQGLLQNRRLTARAVSRASGRAESTINQLLAGNLLPTPEVLDDIAPVLQLDIVDLLVIAGLPSNSETGQREPYPATMEIGQLVAAASFLSPAQVELLVQAARALRDDTRDEGSPGPTGP